MSTAKTTKVSLIINVVVVIAWIVVAFYFAGCATTGTTPQISAERQKAIQDSLAKVREQEMLKNYSIGTENHKNKMFERVLKPLWRAAELDTGHRLKGLYDKLGDSYLQLNKPDSALIVFEMGVKVFPDNDYLHRGLGFLYSALNLRDQSIEHYSKAIDLTRANDAKSLKPDDFRSLGKLLIQEGRLQEAIPIYEELAKMEPQNQEVQETLASLYSQMGDEDAMIDSWLRALELEPNNTELMFKIGKKYFERGDNQQAIEMFKKFLAIQVDDPLVLEYYGDTQQNLGDFRGAITTYEKVIAQKPDRIKVLCDIATCYRELKNFPTARTWANKALSINAQAGLPYFVLGEIYMSTADECMSKENRRDPKFDDRLVYELAYNNFKKALTDLDVGRFAEQQMQYLEDLIPKTEHRFMHQDQTKAELPCYKWIY